MKKVLLLLSAFLLVVACTPQSVDKGKVVQKEITIPTVPTDPFAEGKTLYENNCGRCHSLPSVSQYNDEKWKSIIAWMSPNAKLNPQQSELVLAYVSHYN